MAVLNAVRNCGKFLDRNAKKAGVSQIMALLQFSCLAVFSLTLVITLYCHIA